MADLETVRWIKGGGTDHGCAELARKRFCGCGILSRAILLNAKCRLCHEITAGAQAVGVGDLAAAHWG